MTVNIEALEHIDWSDPESIQSRAEPVLRALAGDVEALGQLVRQAQEGDVRDLWEHYDVLDKLVLVATPAYRIRMHVFLPGHYERPHDHRWPYCSLIVRGAYRHKLYRARHVGDACPSMADLVPCMARIESAGSSYTLREELFHSTEAQAHTVTLIVRGPSVKSRFAVVDRTTGESWWQYGAHQEDTRQQAQRHMSNERAETAVRELSQLQVIA